MVKKPVILTPNPTMLARIKHIPPGGCVRDLPYRLLPKRFQQKGYFKERHSGHSVLRRLTLDGVAPTILASSGDQSLLIHPVEDRFMSARENARLQTFPDNYEFTGGHGAVQRQIGNAVPVLLARQLARALKNWLPE